MSPLEFEYPLRGWRSFKPFVGASWLALAVLVVASMLAGLSEAAVLALVVFIAARMSAGGPGGSVEVGPLRFETLEVPTLLWLVAGLVVLRLVLQIVTGYLPARIAANAQARVRRDLFAAFRRASWELQSREKEGHLQQVLNGEVVRATHAVLSLAAGMAAFLNFTMMVTAALLLNVVVALLVVCVAAVLFVVFRPVARLASRSAKEFMEANMRIAHAVVEAVRMTEETRTFGVGAMEERRVGDLVYEVRRPFFRAQVLRGVLAPLYQSVTLSLIVGGLAALYVAGTEDVAALGAVVLLLVRALSYSQVMQGVYHTLSEMLPSIEKVTATLAQYREAEAVSGAEPLEELLSVSFDHVDFAYVPDEPVLRDLSFELAQGEVVGIVGPSGAGKSTLVQILLRLRQPDTGRLVVNGQPAERFSLDDWFRRVAYLPQDARVIAGSVSENIRYHRQWLSDQAVERAARAAGIHDEIMKWRAGYSTLIGQRADAVSGGQRQRICLARALAGDPDLLVLDEPTSALDVDSERLVQDSLRRRRSDVTVVVIAHRMSTLSDCDRILVLEDGRLAALGTPDEVRASNVFFRRGSSLVGDEKGA